MYNTKNYTEQGGEVTHIGGKLLFDGSTELAGFPGVENFTPKTTTTAADIRADLNKLILGMKQVGLIVPDADPMTVSVLACPTPAAMPTTDTASNSGHATLAIADNLITITLDCTVAELKDANHGETWGTHKWLGFGVRTGLASIEGVKFTDDTGASCVLGAGDASEATALGLSAGDFVLYIKAEQDAYVEGRKTFKLKAPGSEETTYTMKIVETEGE